MKKSSHKLSRNWILAAVIAMPITTTTAQSNAASEDIPDSLPIGSPEKIRAHMISQVDRIWVKLTMSLRDFPRNGGYRAAQSAEWDMYSSGTTNVAEIAKIVFGTGVDEATWLRRGKDAAAAYLANLTVTRADFFERNTNRYLRLTVSWLDRDGSAVSSKRGNSSIGGPFFCDARYLWIAKNNNSEWKTWYFPERPRNNLPWPDPDIIEGDFGSSADRFVIQGLPSARRKVQNPISRDWLLDVSYLIMDGAFLHLPGVVGGVVQAVPLTRNDGMANTDSLVLMDASYSLLGLFGLTNLAAAKLQPVGSPVFLLAHSYLDGKRRGNLTLRFADGQRAAYDLATGKRLPPEQMPSFEKPITVSIRYRPIGMLSYTRWYPRPNLPTVVEIVGPSFSSFSLERSVDLRTWIEVKQSDADLQEHVHDDIGWERFSFRDPPKGPMQFFRVRK